MAVAGGGSLSPGLSRSPCCLPKGNRTGPAAASYQPAKGTGRLLREEATWAFVLSWLILALSDLIREPWVKKRLFLSPSRASNSDLRASFFVKVAVRAGACAELLTLLWEPPAKLPRGQRQVLLSFTQQASPQAVLDAWVPVGDVVAASQLSHKPQQA